VTRFLIDHNRRIANAIALRIFFPFVEIHRNDLRFPSSATVGAAANAHIDVGGQIGGTIPADIVTSNQGAARRNSQSRDAKTLTAIISGSTHNDALERFIGLTRWRPRLHLLCPQLTASGIYESLRTK
jgi:hypothetical protein